MSEFLLIDINTLNDGGFQFYHTGFIRKVLEATGTDHCNWLSAPTKFEAHLGTDYNVSEATRYWKNSAIGVMLYL